jgi:hypothetical protein
VRPAGHVPAGAARTITTATSLIYVGDVRLRAPLFYLLLSLSRPYSPRTYLFRGLSMNSQPSRAQVAGRLVVNMILAPAALLIAIVGVIWLLAAVGNVNG